jgi:chromatin segregation and condensation protein Rec8/ScpA/Scc1 (kleisin family)
VGSAPAVRAEAVGGETGLRFPGFRGPADLLAVLVREGDLGAAGVPVAALATEIAAWDHGGGFTARRQIGALVALTDVWRARLEAAAGLATVADADDLAAAPPTIDPDLAVCVRHLAALEAAARERLGRRPSPPPRERLGSVADLWRAYDRAVARARRVDAVRRLWPLPARVPVFHQMRRLLAGLRRRGRLRLVARGASPPEAVAATLAALELVRRGRVRVWQPRAYGPVFVLRHGVNAARGGGE